MLTEKGHREKKNLERMEKIPRIFRLPPRIANQPITTGGWKAILLLKWSLFRGQSSILRVVYHDHIIPSQRFISPPSPLAHPTVTSDPHEFLALDSRPWHVSDSHTSGQVKLLFLGGYQYWKDGYIDDIDDTRKRSMHLFIIIPVVKTLGLWQRFIQNL